MRLYSFFLCLLLTFGGVFAKNYDLFFHHDANGLSVGKKNQNHIRIRVVNPPENKSHALGFDLVRPFFILDGIYLSTDGLRTLGDFHMETSQFDLPELLSNLGYTPILVQFSETVLRPLTNNASYFSELLHLINQESVFSFPNKQEDGMIVLGISQGGVLGLYGAYQYDVTRTPNESPIRIYGSLDSPHQGAVMPVGLFYTINFWATTGGSADAAAFADLISGPGSSELLVFKAVNDTLPANKRTYEKNFSNQRFLYGEYRKALEYKNFPKILISQGQMKGISPVHGSTYYKLNRSAKKLKAIVGRAQSEMNVSTNGKGQVAYNRVYQIAHQDDSKVMKDSASMDFIQGSLYPFAKTMYSSMRDGFLDAIPDNMIQEIDLPFGNSLKLKIFTQWEADTLIHPSSTFIPTTSAMDLLCGGDISIRNGCAFTEKYSDVNFENPGDRSNATATYAVDPTHPRYNEPISGRHIEMAYQPDGIIKFNVIDGMQVDVWRFLCNVAKYDYDPSRGTFRNGNLAGVFMPNANCMDLSLMPNVISESGLHPWQKFGYSHYEYAEKEYESNSGITLKIPAGWHKVAKYDYGKGLPSGSDFVVEAKVKKSNSSWMKAELLLYKTKNGIGQLQMQEIDVPLDGYYKTLRWPLAFAEEALSEYRWIDLIINSDGGEVQLFNPRIERRFVSVKEPENMMVPMIFPNNQVSISSWNPTTSITSYVDDFGYGMQLDFSSVWASVNLNFGEAKNLKKYSHVKVSYWPGTCQWSKVYFDTYKNGRYSLSDGYADGLFVSKKIPLNTVINTAVTPENGLSATRFVIENTNATERCLIHSIILE